MDEPGKFEIHRCKGRLVLEDGTVKIMQGVREVFEINDAPNGDAEGPLEGKIILIGRNLPSVGFEESFKQIIR